MIKDYTIKTDAPPLPRLPGGRGLISVILPSLPSFNDVIYLTPPVRFRLIRAERQKGYKIGLDIGRALGIPTKIVEVKSKSLRNSRREVLTRYLTDKKLFCFVKIFREASLKDNTKGKRKRDVYNECLKALIDGLTDSGVWEDDNEAIHNNVWISYAGTHSTPVTEITFYEN